MAEKSSGSWWKWLLAVVVIAAAAGGFIYVRHSHGSAPNYNTAVVARGDLTQTVTATGTLNPVVNVTVGSQVSGRICKLNVDYNSIVKSNQVIAEIDPATYQAAVEQAEADLANAEANLELQQVEYRRSSDLFTNRLISGSDYDTAMANLHEAQAMVKIKQASLNNAAVNLDYCKIVSPVDGVVILRAVELGQTVASSFSTPTIFQIANDLTKMQIDANVAEADVGGIQEGQPVEFTVDAYPYRTFHGDVIQVRNSPTTVNNVVTYDAVISVTNSDYKLKPGMTANVSVIVAERSNALKIPNAAMRFRPPETALVITNGIADPPATNLAATMPPGQRAKLKGNRNLRTVYLLVTDNGADKLKQVQVKTGINDGISTEVLDGLAEGDKLVVGILNPGATGTGAGSSPFGGGGFPRR
jgi:HlyD family secretion protein